VKEFFEDINKLKHTERQGWEKHEVERPRDTIASHSFGASLIGWVLAEREGLDSDKVVKMLLMHDLIMAYVEDYTPEDDEFDSKKEKELEASEKLFNDVPDIIEEEFRKLFDELQSMDSEEAKLANEGDKLDTVLQASKYSEESDNGFLEEFLEFYRDEINTDTASEILDSIGEKD